MSDNTENFFNALMDENFPKSKEYLDKTIQDKLWVETGSAIDALRNHMEKPDESKD